MASQRPPPTVQEGKARQVHVVLVEPEIHWNTGNVGRTCLAVGAQLHLIEPLGFSLDDKQVRRAGLDYWPRVAPRIWKSWGLFETQLPTLGEPYFFSAEGKRSFWQARYPTRTVLVFGRESTGLTPELRRQHRERLLHIPMNRDSQLRSLNLSTSVALALYEVERQQAG